MTTELALLEEMGPLSRLEAILAWQVNLPASEKVREEKERVSIVWSDTSILFLNHW